MNANVFRKLVFLIVFLSLFTGCKKVTVEDTKESLFKEYSEHYLLANSPFADTDQILSAIEYMEDIIEKEGNKNVTSIYYDKARLLFRLKQYDDALYELFLTEDDFYDIYKATLLIRLGRENEAELFLKKAIERNKNELIAATALKEQKNVSRNINLIVQGTIALYILNDRSIESVLSEFINDNILTQQEAEVLLQEELFKFDPQEMKMILLSNMWPE